jgi:HD-GYP domain-containing protein (c-di-GMP phosphodiesterase class II)
MPDPAPAPSSSLQLQRLVLAIVRAVNGRALYPADHPRVRESVDQLVASLESLLIARHQHSINLLLIDDDLVIDQRPFRFAGLHLGGFIHAMKALGVEGITFGRGLDAEEVQVFLSAIADRETAVSTPHIVVGRVKLAFTGSGEEQAAGGGDGSGAAAPGTGDEGEGGGGGEDVLGAGGGRRPLITEAHLEEARGAFVRFRTDRKGSLAQMEALVWGFIDTLSQGAELALPLAPLREHDELTYIHSVHVALLVLGHARALGFRGEVLKEIGLGGLLHDIGKLAVPAEILRKAGPLTEAEWAEIKRHPELGAAHLCELDPTTTVPALVAYEHHLRFDGEPNYPRLRTRRQPILASQLTAVADTFDAVQTVRPYSQSATRDEAFRALRRRAGTYLDPLLVASFCTLFGATKPTPARPAA